MLARLGLPRFQRPQEQPAPRRPAVERQGSGSGPAHASSFPPRPSDPKLQSTPVRNFSLPLSRASPAGSGAQQQSFPLYKESDRSLGGWTMTNAHRRVVIANVEKAGGVAVQMKNGRHLLPLVDIGDPKSYLSHCNDGRYVAELVSNGGVPDGRAMPDCAVPLDISTVLRPSTQKNSANTRSSLQSIYTFQTTPEMRLVNSGGAGDLSIHKLPDMSSARKGHMNLWFAPVRDPRGNVYAEIFDGALLWKPDGWVWSASAGRPGTTSSAQMPAKQTIGISTSNAFPRKATKQNGLAVHPPIAGGGGTWTPPSSTKRAIPARTPPRQQTIAQASIDPVYVDGVTGQTLRPSKPQVITIHRGKRSGMI